MDFATFKSTVKGIVFPIGEPENLVAQHDAYIVDGLNHIQKFVKCYQENNVNVISFPDTFYNCGLTVTNAPDGFIKRVYSIASDGCCKVNYAKSTRAQIQHLSNTQAIDFGEKTRPDQGSRAPLPGTDLYPSANADSAHGRATSGYWALEGCRLYLFPWLQSTEDLVIEWTGIKDTYANGDTMFDASTAVQRAVRFYLQREIARDLDQDDQKVERYTVDFQDAMGDLVWKCRQKLEGTYAEEDELPIILNGCASPGTVGSFTPGGPDDPNTPVTNPWLYRFAVIGGYGMPLDLSVNANLVSDMVKGWSPLFVTTTGGNILRLTGSGSFPALDERMGRNYHQFISPYLGTYGPGSTTGNQMWPTLSSDEAYESVRRLQYLNYFPLPAANNKRYYDRIEGPVHLFFMDSYFAAPDGNSASSIQADWLRVKLATSPCKFKIVFIADPPYASHLPSVVTAVRWPFAAWGATMVLTGGTSRGYERLAADGIPIILNGSGGDDMLPTPPTLIDSRSVAHDFLDNGAQLVTVNCDSIKLEFFAVDGTLKDTITINAPTTSA